jgi:hypothetical protein
MRKLGNGYLVSVALLAWHINWISNRLRKLETETYEDWSNRIL